MLVIFGFKIYKYSLPAVLTSTRAFAGLHATNVSSLVGGRPEEIHNN
jgi:hypothetical protein